MPLLLGQLIYTSFSKVGFQALTSAAVPPEIRREFVEQIVYEYWDSYNPPSSEYRAVYLHRISLNQMLFGWLYNDGIDDFGRSHVPYFICYYLTELLQPVQLDAIFAYLLAGPTSILDRHSPPVDLENIIIPEVGCYQPARLGVEVATQFQAQSHLNVQQEKLFRLFVPEESTQPSTLTAATSNLALLEELSSSEVLSGVGRKFSGNSVAAAKLELVLDELLEQLEVETYREILLSKVYASQSAPSRGQTIFLHLEPWRWKLGLAIGIFLLIALAFSSLYVFRDTLMATIVQPIVRLNRSLPPYSETLTTKTLLDNAPVWSVVLNPNGQTVIGGGANQKIKIWSIEAGSVLNTLSGHTDVVRSLALTPDGKTLVSGSDDRTIKLWNLSTNQLIQTLDQPSPVWSVAISQDGKTLVSGSEDGTITVLQLPTATPVRTIAAHESRIFSVAVSSDGKTVASAGFDRTIKIWNAESGTLLRTLTGHTDAVRALKFSPNGQSLVSASWDTTLKLWNWQTGDLLHTFVGHTARVVDVTFSPDGQTLISGGIDKTINLWSVQTGKLLRPLVGHTDWVLAVATDNKHLVSSSEDETIRIWQFH